MSAVPSLTLSVHDATGSRRIVVDGAGATLGRGTDCSVVLADTRRAISRLQARIDWRDGHYLLTDSGSNPTLVNGRIPGVSREVVLHDGDTLTIDVYRIVIEIEGASHGEDATVFAALAGREEEEVDAPTMVRVPEREAADLVDAVTQLRAADQAQAAPGESGALDAVDELPDTPTMVRLPVIATPQAPQVPQAAPTQQQASSITQVAPSMQAGPLESVEAATTRHAEPIDPTAHDTLLVALCDGLGIDAASLAGRNATDVARLAGALLRDAVGGAMAALRTGHMPGAAAGPELDGADPLRDRGDVETALRLLLSASAASASRDRLRDAFGELRDRQLALRGGLREVLAGLDPARLEPEAAGWRDWLPGSAARLRAQYARDWTRVSQQAAATLDSPLAAPSQQAPN